MRRILLFQSVISASMLPFHLCKVRNSLITQIDPSLQKNPEELMIFSFLYAPALDAGNSLLDLKISLAHYFL